MLWFKTRQFI